MVEFSAILLLCSKIALFLGCAAKFRWAFIAIFADLYQLLLLKIVGVFSRAVLKMVM
jgi:hypothetical protein